jgi:iron(III) transport system substrate-binding protein
VTPALIAAAKKEGKVVYYTSIDLPLAEKIAKAFEAKYPASPCASSAPAPSACSSASARSTASRIYACDVVNSSDAAHFIAWKRDGILRPTCRRTWRSSIRRAQGSDGQFASFRVGCSVIGYNTNLVKADEAPKSFADLLDPKWSGKMVKAHPGYSGNVMSATFQMQRDLGWDYLEKLAKQKIMQVQSSSDPPKKLALGERAVMVDGNEYNALQLKESRPAGSRSSIRRGHADGRRAERDLQERAQPERRAAVAQLHVLGRMPAARHRRRRLRSSIRASRSSRAASRSRTSRS